MLEKMKEVFNHNVFVATALAVIICLGVWLIGCESQTQSPFNPKEKVTREQLVAQVELYNTNVRLAFDDLEKQDLFKQYLIDSALVVAQGGTLSPSGLIVGAIGILGVGAVADNRRKDAVIKTLKNNGNNKTTA